MKFNNIKHIITDIEGTTTSVAFVYDVLFPYFKANINGLKDLVHIEEVQQAFKATSHLSNKLEDRRLTSVDQIIQTLTRWCNEDRKVTPLKDVQGIIWKKGYEEGEIKGHIYPDVLGCLKSWTEQGKTLSVFSSGSISAQKLLFGFSESGDLRPYFIAYHDTNTGTKKDEETYRKITEELDVNPSNTLFLSDIKEELEAAQNAGLQTCQLTRPGIEKNWDVSVADFNEIEF